MAASFSLSAPLSETVAIDIGDIGMSAS
jgi:hypothetical protein